MSRRVAVLMGGTSPERDVSLVSGAAVADALRDRGYAVDAIDVTGDVRALIDALDPAPDVVFNALHGRHGEDGCVQGLLELLGIPYTHSGVAASAVAMDKPLAKRLFAEAGIPCPDGKVMDRDAVLAGDGLPPPPYVIKPLNQGSSVGVRVVLDGEAGAPFGNEPWPFGDRVLVETYIPGREIHVAIMGDRALGAVEIRPKGRFYDYAAKYEEGQAEHLMPAPLPKAAYDEALRLGLNAHRAAECRGVTRADLRYDDTGSGETGQFALLEINTQPGMTPLSLVPEIAAHAGIPFADLVTWMVENAACDR